MILFIRPSVKPIFWRCWRRCDLLPKDNYIMRISEGRENKKDRSLNGETDRTGTRMDSSVQEKFEFGIRAMQYRYTA
jgi:hypothetical protein